MDMIAPKFDTVEIGDEIPGLVLAPISRTTLALFAGASGDHTPLHIDTDFVRENGMSDVFAHGMLSMAYIGRSITNWVPIDRLRHYSVRFLAVTQLHDTVTCTGKVIEKFVADGENRVRIALQSSTQSEKITLQGEAVVALD
jgi:acyl dehydratase